MIAFYNGSYIKVFSTSDSARADRYHLLITDPHIDDDIINYVLRPTEILEWIDKQKQHDTDDFKTVYFAKPYSPRIWQSTEDKEFETVSEIAFMQVLNIPISQ